MPIYDLAAVAGSGIVSLDSEGFVVIAGGPPPFKDEYEDLGNGFLRVTHSIKHPTYGALIVSITDVPTA